MRIALVLITSALQVLGKGLISSPKNVVCIGKMKYKDSRSSIWPRIKCTWDHDQYTTDIMYRVHLKQDEEHICESSEKNCSFPDDVIVMLDDTLNVSVSAEDAYGYSALSNEVTYSEGWDIVQMDSPTDVIAEPLPDGLRVSWQIAWFNTWLGKIECEIRLHEKGSKSKNNPYVHTETFFRLVSLTSGFPMATQLFNPNPPVVKNPENCFLTAMEITEVKPCTNYSVSMRSRFHRSVWSTWSPHVTVTSYLNVSGSQFHLWRSKSILRDWGNRTLHLMWKGVPPSCKAFDKYCIFFDSQRIPKCFGPFQDHTFITLDEHSHRITVAMVRNGTSLNEASIEVPAMARGLISSPKNVVCIGKTKYKDSHSSIWPRIKCTWDHDQYTTDITYRVHLKQDEEHICESSEKNCSFPDDVIVMLDDTLNVSVSAEDAYGYSALSNEVTYSEGWDIVQMDSPTDVTAEPLPEGLRVSWQIAWFNTWIGKIECEIRLHEEGSKSKPVVKNPENCFLTAMEITEVKPCTNYSVSMRSRFHRSVWSTWSPHVTATSYLNVSGSQFHLWRSKSILRDWGNRTLHLMWKGVPPSCKAFDEYCIFFDSQRIPKCFGPFQDHTFITLDEHSHRITVAMVRNGTSLNAASIEVPATAREVNLPPVGNVNMIVQHGQIQITWNKPSLPVTGYIIVWNSTVENHMWQQTLQTSFTLKGEPFTLYTISLTPLYIGGPGNEITLHNCNQEGNINKVSKIEVTRVSDTYAEIRWLPVLPTQCCAFVLNYTVFYKIYNESKPRNVTVRANEHHVILRDLQAGTEYNVYIMANTVAASSKSVPITFLTNPNSNFLFIVTIILLSCCVLLILLSMLALMIQKKLLNKKIPDPRFSSLSMWPSENCRKAWRLLPVSGGRDTEKILPCHLDSEVISVSPTSKKDMAAVKALTDIQNNDPASQTEKKNAPVAASFTNKDLLSFGGSEQRVPLDMQSSEMCPVPPVQSPYRKQTPVNSPVESLSKPVWLDETETLLTPKHKNSNYFASYVTLDLFDPKKYPNK